MHTLVLAAGYATRLRPLTLVTPKPLLPLGDRTILGRILDATVPLGSVTVRANRLHEPLFRAALKGVGAKLEVEEHVSDDDKPGAVTTILDAAEGLDDDLLVVGGDNVFGWGIGAFVEACQGRPGVALVDLGSRERAKRFGVATLRADGGIDAFHEKPQAPPSTLAATATYHYPRAVLPRLLEYRRSGGSMDAPGHLVRWLCQLERVQGPVMQGPWFDVGSWEGYLEAAKALTKGTGHDRARDCRLEGLVAIHGAEASGSRLSDVILLEGARVTDSDLERVVVSPGATIKGLTLRGSLVGPFDVLSG